MIAETVAPRDAAQLVTLDELVGDLATVVHLERREDYVLVILWASQSWLGPTILPERCLAYLDFTGPKSAGKSTTTEAACHIAGGKMVAGGSEAAIRDILNGGESGIPPKALGIDELDVRLRSLPDLEGIFRVGNRWHAEYPIRVPKPKGRGWDTVPLNVGGPKVFNYRNDPEDALASRTIVIEMKPHRDASMIVHGLFESPALDRVRDVLMKRAATSRWNSRSLEDHMKSPPFVARVEGLVAQLPRGLQVGAVLLAVSDIMGFDAESVVAQYVAEEHEDSLEAEREILAAIVREHEPVSIDAEVRIPNADVHAALNARLKDRGLPSVSVREWPRVRRELGITTTRRGRGLLLGFGCPARKNLGLEDGEGAG